MKNVSIVTRSFAILGVLAAAFTMTPAWAQSTPASQHSTVLRVSYQGETHTGLCCSTWDGKVTMNEPENPLRSLSRSARITVRLRRSTRHFKSMADRACYMDRHLCPPLAPKTGHSTRKPSNG
jgi:hypothetical protein